MKRRTLTQKRSERGSDSSEFDPVERDGSEREGGDGEGGEGKKREREGR